MAQSVEWIFDSALSHTRRSDAVEIRVDTLAQIRLRTSFESSPVSVNSQAPGSPGMATGPVLRRFSLSLAT